MNAAWSWRDVPRRAARPPDPAPPADGTTRTLRDLEATVRRLCTTVETLRVELVAPRPVPPANASEPVHVTWAHAVEWATANDVGLPPVLTPERALPAINAARVTLHRLPPFRIVVLRGTTNALPVGAGRGRS